MRQPQRVWSRCSNKTGRQRLHSCPIMPSPPIGLPRVLLFRSMPPLRGGVLTSDGSLPWLVEADQQLGIGAAFAGCLTDWRKDPSRARHSLEHLVRQRIFQLACGYADQDDADTLRTYPLFKLACGQRPLSGRALASQPTLCRVENCVDRPTCRLAEALVQIYVHQRERNGLPTRLLLDCDRTADPTPGDQAGSAYHGYDRQHMSQPLLLFDGDTGQLSTAILRPGTAHARRRSGRVLRLLLRLLRACWPTVAVELRADRGFANPALSTFCEREQIASAIGLATNSRLEPLAQDLLTEAIAQQKASGAARVRLVGEAPYQAGTWDKARRVVYKAAALVKGPITRLVVTARTDPPLTLYDHDVDRGVPEQWIDQLKATCFAERLRCCDFWPNQFRLLLAPRYLARLAQTQPPRPAALGNSPANRAEDRRTGKRTRHPGPSAPRIESSRPSTLAHSCSSSNPS
jgi:hypothetical protein